VNKKQRDLNRETSQDLGRHSRYVESRKHTCENCGERGRHWVQAPMTLEQILDHYGVSGFWTCPKYYSPDGRRISH